MRFNLKILKIFIVIAWGVFLLNSCQDTPKQDKTIAVFVLGDASVIRQGEAKRPLKAKESLLNQDILKTGKLSYIHLQVRNDVVILINPESEVKLSEIQNINQKNIQLEKGQILTKLNKLFKEQSFNVKTPSTVIGVRGTHFLVSYEENISTVSVGSGAVSVTRVKNQQEILLEPGRTVEINEAKDSVEQRNVNQYEKERLNTLNQLPVIENINQATDNQLNQTGGQSKIKVEELINLQQKTTQDKPILTLEDLKAKYGRIDTISLYNGRKIQGVILSRGSVYKVLTLNGTMNIPYNSIKGTE